LTIRKVVPILLATAILAAIIILFVRQIEIDRCLDRGGRWDYTEEVCDY
jgi:hypothetical protein